MIPDPIDQEMIKQLQGDIPLVVNPYAVLAEEIGISEEEYLQRIEKMQAQGIMRRLAAVLRHRESGYQVNAMLVWQQDEATADAVGDKLAEFNAISHLYLRSTDEAWPYNMYAMVHAQSEQELTTMAAHIADLTGNAAINMVKSVHEYKKVSMQYVF